VKSVLKDSKDFYCQGTEGKSKKLKILKKLFFYHFFFFLSKMKEIAFLFKIVLLKTSKISTFTIILIKVNT
jgi:hypothetical protein